MRLFVSTILCFFLIFPHFLFAESVPARTYRALLIYEGIDAPKMKPSLSATLLRQGLPLTVIPSELPKGASEEEINKETQRFACDTILSVTVSSPTKTVWKVEWSLRSTQESNARYHGEIEKDPGNWSDSAEIFWLFLIEPLQDAFLKPTKPWPKPIESLKGRFTVQALPGTELRGIAKDSVFVPAAGSIDVDLDLPKTIELQGILFSHRTKSQLLFVENPNRVVQLEQQPMPQYAVTAYLNNFSFPASMFEWSFLPGRAFTRVGIDQFLGGFYISDNRRAGTFQWPVTSLPLFYVSGGIGLYFSSPDDFVRFYSTFDLSLRLMFPQFKYFGLDPLVPIQFQTMLGADIRLWEGGTWFLEMGPTYYFVTDSLSFMSLKKKDSGALGFFQLFGSPVYAEIPFQAKVGYRWTF